MPDVSHQNVFKSSAYKRRSRAGVTVLEVLFAIGIVIVGLLGIASLLPLAGRQASESARAAESQALAQDWYAEFFVRDLANRENWIYLSSLKPADPPAVSYNFATSVLKPQSSVCIDPLFFSEADFSWKSTSSSPSQAYAPSLFPYYSTDYDPTQDPVAGSLGVFTPRMYRVTYPMVGIPTLVPVPVKWCEQVFASQDELAMTVDPADGSVPPTRVFTPFGSISDFARGATQTQYSWIATLSPNDNYVVGAPIDSATLSLVVIYKRERQFFFPTGSVGSDDKPTGERLALVTSLSGNFSGGNGGLVRLTGTDALPNKLQIGDWVMLGKQNSGVTDGLFRWFRIVASNDANISSGMWARDVVLDGPDWDFSGNPTVATMVSGAVAVIERVVDLKLQ